MFAPLDRLLTVGVLPSVVKFSNFATYYPCHSFANLCRYVAFAVNYFIGSGPFIRALRYWALSASTLAQQIAPSANGFKLSDTVLVPLIRQPRQRLESGQIKSVDVLVPPGVQCDNETQIFEALGLRYVPPYMRYFGSDYQ